MKKTIITIAALFAAAATYAQGTVNFTTKSGTAVDALVTYAGTSTTANGDFWGQLFWSAPGGNNWTAIGSPQPFRTGTGQGYITAGAQTTTAAAGATVDIQFRGWASAKIAGGSDAGFGSGSGPGYSSSVLPNVTLGGGGNPPATPTLLTGLQGFVIPVVPEPSLAALGLLGAGLLLIRRKK